MIKTRLCIHPPGGGGDKGDRGEPFVTWGNYGRGGGGGGGRGDGRVRVKQQRQVRKRHVGNLLKLVGGGVGVWGEERVRKKWVKKERIRSEKFIEVCAPIGSSMLSKRWVHIHVGDSNSHPPD
jgi:hypothetical protein